MRNGMHTDAYGTKQWYFNGERHREDGPASEWDDGTKQWYFNGNLVNMEDVITDPKEQFWWKLIS